MQKEQDTTPKTNYTAAESGASLRH